MSAEQGNEDGLILALETSGDVCSVALSRGEVLLSSCDFRHQMHLSERLMGQVDGILRETGATLESLAALAVGIGPGSFTGTRIAVMTVKTLAAVTEKPVVGIGSLDALAAEYTGLRDVLTVPILPCRANVVFTCLFTVEGDTPLGLTEPAALSLEELVEQCRALNPAHLLFCGEAVRRYEKRLRELLTEAQFFVSFGQASAPRAALVARLAALRLRAGLPPDDAMTLVPLYVSPPPITLPRSMIKQE